MCDFDLWRPCKHTHAYMHSLALHLPYLYFYFISRKFHITHSFVKKKKKYKKSVCVARILEHQLHSIAKSATKHVLIYVISKDKGKMIPKTTTNSKYYIYISSWANYKMYTFDNHIFYLISFSLNEEKEIDILLHFLIRWINAYTIFCYQ